MGKQIIAFGNIEVEKQKFHQHKNPISIYNVNIDRIAVSYKVLCSKNGFKCFVAYEDDSEKLMALCIIFQKISAYRSDFE